jgi:hypothetical protein
MFLVACTSAEHQGSQGGLHQSGALQPIVQVSAQHGTWYRGLPQLGMGSIKAAEGVQGCQMLRGTRKRELKKEVPRGERYYDSEKAEAKDCSYMVYKDY